MTRALIVVDVQNDFVEGGSLAVNGGLTVAYRIANGLNALLTSDMHDYVVATKDYHNAWPDTNDGHFGNPPDFVDTWPIHCVAGERGAEFANPISAVEHLFDEVFRKGQGRPAYSGFQGVTSTGILLDEWLDTHGVTSVDVCGIATDYCVRATALDAISIGLNARVIPGWCAAVGGPEAHKKTIAEIEEANARLQKAGPS